MSKINSQELLRNLSVWMNQAPKGFEKFQRDRKRGAAAQKEPPKEPKKSHIPPPPSKSTSGQEKKGFSFKFEIPSSGGGGAGGGSKPGGENQEELLKKAGMALVVVAGMYYLHVQVRITEKFVKLKNEEFFSSKQSCQKVFCL